MPISIGEAKNQVKMKKLFLIALVSLSTQLFGQRIDTVSTDKMKLDYMELIQKTYFSSDILIVYIEYDQNSNKKYATQVNDRGVIMKFPSILDMLEFMNTVGYEFVNGIDPSVDRDDYYLIRKKK